MEYLLFGIIGIMFGIIFALLIKIRLLQKSIKEITEAFQDRLTTDTNILIDISSRDPYLLKLAADINEQLRLLRKERHRYQQGDRGLKEAVTNLSHDLRTPLTAIKGYLDLLDREEKSDRVQDYLFRIRERMEALICLTEELFNYSLVTSAQPLDPERLDLVRVVEESLISFYGLMKERGIEPQISLPEEPVWRELDRIAVNRVFTNIISNALKYSDGDLSVIMEKNGTVAFTNTASNLDHVSVGQLFNRFYTVEAGRNSTGLGLAIAKDLTDRMGGRIEADYSGNELRIIVWF